MNPGEKIILTEGVVVVDSLGADYLPQGTAGIVRENIGEMLTVATSQGVYDIPAKAAKAVPEDKAA